MPVIPVQTPNKFRDGRFPMDAAPQLLGGKDIPETMPVRGWSIIFWAVLVGVVIGWFDVLWIFPVRWFWSIAFHWVMLVAGCYLAVLVLPERLCRHYLHRLTLDPRVPKDVQQAFKGFWRISTPTERAKACCILFAGLLGLLWISGDNRAAGLVAVILIVGLCIIMLLNALWQVHCEQEELVSMMRVFPDKQVAPDAIWKNQWHILSAVYYWFQVDYPRDIPNAAQSVSGRLGSRAGLTIATLILVTVPICWFTHSCGVVPVVMAQQWERGFPVPENTSDEAVTLLERVNRSEFAQAITNEKVYDSYKNRLNGKNPLDEHRREMALVYIHQRKALQMRPGAWIIASGYLMVTRPWLFLVGWLVALVGVITLPLLMVATCYYARLGYLLPYGGFTLTWWNERENKREAEILRVSNLDCAEESEGVMIGHIIDD